MLKCSHVPPLLDVVQTPHMLLQNLVLLLARKSFYLMLKVLVDTGNFINIGMCVTEDFFVCMGGQVVLSPLRIQVANKASVSWQCSR